MNIYTKETQRERPIKPFHRPLRDKTHLHQPTSHFLSMRTKPVPKEQSHNTSLPAISRTSNSHDVETYDQQPRHPSSRPSSNLSSHPSSYPSSRHTSRKDEDTNTSRSYSEEEQQNPKPISEATSNPLLPKNQQLTETPSNVPLPASITATVPPQVAVPIVLSEATNSAEDGNSWNHNVFDSVSVVSVSDQQTA